MRRVLLVALVLVLAACASVSAARVEPDAAVMDAPQLDDLSLLQTDAQTHVATVSELEAQLSAAEASEAALQAAADHEAEVLSEADAHSAEALAAEFEAMAAAEVSAEVQGEAVTETAADAGVDASATVEAEAAAEVEAEVDVEAEVEAEMEADSESESEAEVEADADAESDAELEAEVEAEVEAEAESEMEAEADAAAAEEEAHKPRSLVEHAGEKVNVKKSAKKAAKKAAKKSAKKAAKKAKKAAKKAARKAKKAAKKAAKKVAKKAAAKQSTTAAGKSTPRRRRWGEHEVSKVERSDEKLSPDVVHLKKGGKLYKSWVVSPKLRMELPPPKKVLVHSKERVMTQSDADKLVQHAKTRGPRPLSAVRRQFLKLNPEQRAAKLRSRYLSPAAAMYRAFKQGQFPQLKFDPPTSTATSVTQHLTVRHNSPTVRQRAEVSALRAATRTLRRINSKAREFGRALKALRLARKGVQKQIHRHHVVRAMQAKKVAQRAARRAAWSSLLQHNSLRKELMRTMARALRKGHLTGAARRQAIAALLKQNISPKERARLHKFIKSNNTRRNRHKVRRARQIARRMAKGKKVAQKKVRAAASLATASAAATATLSKKDQTAVAALIKRIRAAINHPQSKAAVKSVASVSKKNKAKAASATAAKATAKAAPKAAKAAPKSAKAVPKVKAAPKAAKAAKVTPVRFAQVSAAASLQAASEAAAEAEAEALAQLDADSELDAPEDFMMQTEAHVAAALETTNDFIQAHTFAVPA